MYFRRVVCWTCIYDLAFYYLYVNQQYSVLLYVIPHKVGEALRAGNTKRTVAMETPEDEHKPVPLAVASNHTKPKVPLLNELGKKQKKNHNHQRKDMESRAQTRMRRIGTENVGT